MTDTSDGTTLATLEPKIVRAEFAGPRGQIIALPPLGAVQAASGTIISFDTASGKITRSIEGPIAARQSPSRRRVRERVLGDPSRRRYSNSVLPFPIVVPSTTGPFI